MVKDAARAKIQDHVLQGVERRNCALGRVTDVCSWIHGMGVRGFAGDDRSRGVRAEAASGDRGKTREL